MFLELAEALDCPRCREGYGLVTFVARADRRRVLEGHLGCPMCEVEFPVEGGTIRFGSADDGKPGHGVPEASHGGVPDEDAPEEAPELAVRLAGLLGLGEGAGRAVLLGPGLGRAAVAVGGMAGRVEILAWLETGDERGAWDVEELARGVNPVRGADPARWPVRAGVLDGVALAAPDAGSIEEAVRALRLEGRLVLLRPEEGVLEGLGALSVEELASDASAWVGRRS